ncbi:hypothetical protein [Streptomyces sp. CBMA152]|uniref:hypothetical protein n=1 Tax=Streptomyces sp. CBMA152 TaxID=1896312 RepID=UPI00166049E4|nr:hypothetical protein [Streptomyces sp. CBMA152]MBD0746146.1 hypothetical protein [Streptomyces sp. CBMA152]
MKLMTCVRPGRPRLLAAALAAAAAVPVLTAASPATGSAPVERLDVRQGPGTAWTTDTPHLTPGTTERRYLDVVSSFSRPMTLTSQLSGEGVLTGKGGLRTAVEVCSVSWAADGSCPGARRSLLADSPLAEARSLPAEPLAPNTTRHLKFSIKVPKVLPEHLYGSSGRAVLRATASDTASTSGGGGNGGSQTGGPGGGNTGGTGQSGDTQGQPQSQGQAQGQLSHTGATLLPIAFIAAGALIAGLAAVIARRRARI